VAEACYNLDLEYLKNRLEVTDDGFNTEATFKLVDVCNLNYLDMAGIKVFMEQYFKNMVEVGNNPFSAAGTGMYLDTRPKFYKSIMRRLGVDSTHKINYQEFATLLKSSQPSNIKRAFDQNLD